MTLSFRLTLRRGSVMLPRRKVVQVVWLALLAAASFASPSRAEEQKWVYCNICVSVCSQAPQACTDICEAGRTVSSQCFGAQSCTGAGGGTYAASVTCQVSVEN